MREGDGFEVEREGEIRQARQFPRALLRDARISFAAKGLFAFLWDLPAGWRVRASHLASVGPNGRDAVRSTLRELEAVSALRVEVVRGERGRVAGKRWVLRSPHLWAIETPLSGPKAPPDGHSTEGRETRLSESPKVGETGPKVFTNLKDSSSAPAEILAPKAPQDRFEEILGISTWTLADREAARALAAKVSAEELNAAIAAVEDAGKEPLPSRVSRELSARARRARSAKRKKTKVLQEGGSLSSPEAAAAGLRAAKTVLTKATTTTTTTGETQ